MVPLFCVGTSLTVDVKPTEHENTGQITGLEAASENESAATDKIAGSAEMRIDLSRIGGK